jgi:hypothetical protein
MKSTACILALSTIALSLVSGAAYADQGLTREQVQAEAIAARDNGDLPIGYAARTSREIFVDNGKSGTPLHAAVVDANDLPLGYSGRTKNEVFGGSVADTPSKVTREEVRKELFAAEKAGSILTGFAALSRNEVFPAPAQAGTERHLAVAVSQSN